MIEQVDILAIGAHPDDVELSCSGTLLSHIDQGFTVGLLDLTRGELGTRGTAETRTLEAEDSRQLMGARFRVQLDLGDGFFEVNQESLIQVIEVIRACRPRIVLANALSDRHPDHAKGAELSAKACFLSGLKKLPSNYNGKTQEHWRPDLVLHYIQDHFQEPDILIDISKYYEQKQKLIKCFKTQFYDPESQEPETPISSKAFWDFPL
jgi:bacillithiol biosynthesis deacetylase BshB1